VKKVQHETDWKLPRFDPAPIVPPADTEYPIDLTTALRLAEVENPVIAEAQQRVREAAAIQLAAYALMLPTLNAGASYHGHAGDLQRSTGRILDVSSQALYVGGGARTIAAESVSIPAVNIFSALTDAIYEPLATRQITAATRYSAAATANSTLLDVAHDYLDLVAAHSILEARRLSTEQGMEIARFTKAYAEAQQGRPADAHRAATELALLTREYQQAEEEVAVASVRLARRLHLEQTVRLKPAGPGLPLFTLVDPDQSLPELIDVAVRRRPEVAARASEVAAAQVRVRQEQMRPLLPTVWLGFSGGVFGGGSNLVPPLMGNFSGRTDTDVRVFWTLQNFGFGNLNLQRRRKAEVGQASGEQSRMIAQVRTEVTEAYARATAARQQVKTSELQLKSAQGGFAKDFERIHFEVGRPINVVDSLKLVNAARVDLINAVNEYDKAELALYVALGSPPPLDRPADEPLPEAPVAQPPLPPLASGHSLERPPVRSTEPSMPALAPVAWDSSVAGVPLPAERGAAAPGVATGPTAPERTTR
jgi:outer membrane protein TolC